MKIKLNLKFKVFVWLNNWQGNLIQVPLIHMKVDLIFGIKIHWFQVNNVGIALIFQIYLSLLLLLANKKVGVIVLKNCMNKVVLLKIIPKAVILFKITTLIKKLIKMISKLLLL